VVKAQTNKVRLAQLKGELVDRAQAIAHVFKLARAEREAWINWPNRIGTDGSRRNWSIDEHTSCSWPWNPPCAMHLIELGELCARVD
jgi:hypothetical protein